MHPILTYWVVRTNDINKHWIECGRLVSTEATMQVKVKIKVGRPYTMLPERINLTMALMIW